MAAPPLMAPSVREPFANGGNAGSNKVPQSRALYKIFQLEHNRLVDQFKNQNPDWDVETLFEEARRWNIAFFQKITSREYLASVLGKPLPPYTGWNSTIDPGPPNIVTFTGLRYGHFVTVPLVSRLNKDLQSIPEGPLLLRDVYFQESKWIHQGIEPVIRGMVNQLEGSGNYAVDDIRNYLFGYPNLGSDLITTNIMVNIVVRYHY